MTPIKELLRLYGAAALHPSTRLLHERVQQLELQNQMLEQKIEDERQEFQEQKAAFWRDYKELQERVFVRKENLAPIKTDEAPIKITKRKATKIRDKIAEMKRNEAAYYERLNTSQE